MPFNLDIKTGKTLALEDVLWIGRASHQHFELSELDDKASYEADLAYPNTALKNWHRGW